MINEKCDLGMICENEGYQKGAPCIGCAVGKDTEPGLGYKALCSGRKFEKAGNRLLSRDYVDVLYLRKVLLWILSLELLILLSFVIEP
jgi:hypothetical protein